MIKMIQRDNRGFTLIEVMIVVAIIAIIAGIAYPSYNSHILKTRRVEAKEALTSIATNQERWFFQFNQYSTNPDDFGLKQVGGNFFTQNDYYRITINNTPCGTTSCYTAVATAVGTQVKDEECVMLTLRQTGQKQSYDKNNAETTNVSGCW